MLENKKEVSVEKPVAIVTGCTNGVGLETCKLLSTSGYKVIAVSRNIDKMKILFKDFQNVEPYQMDITEYNLIPKMYEDLKNENIVAIINNVGGSSGISDIEVDEIRHWKNSYDLNVIAPMEISKYFLPIMKKNQNGNIVMVTSMCGHHPFRGGANYCAAKRAEMSLTESMRLEFSKYNIRVTQIIPGTINTHPGNDIYEALLPKDVAEAIRWSIMLPKTVNIDTIQINHVRSTIS